MVLKQGLHLDARQTIAQTKHNKTDTVKPGQTFASSQPKITVPRLQHGVDAILRQAGFGAPCSNNQSFDRETRTVGIARGSIGAFADLPDRENQAKEQAPVNQGKMPRVLKAISSLCVADSTTKLRIPRYLATKMVRELAGGAKHKRKRGQSCGHFNR